MSGELTTSSITATASHCIKYQLKAEIESAIFAERKKSNSDVMRSFFSDAEPHHHTIKSFCYFSKYVLQSIIIVYSAGF